MVLTIILILLSLSRISCEKEFLDEGSNFGHDTVLSIVTEDINSLASEISQEVGINNNAAEDANDIETVTTDSVNSAFISQDLSTNKTIYETLYAASQTSETSEAELSLDDNAIGEVAVVEASTVEETKTLEPEEAAPAAASVVEDTTVLALEETVSTAALYAESAAVDEIAPDVAAPAVDDATVVSAEDSSSNSGVTDHYQDLPPVTGTEAQLAEESDSSPEPVTVSSGGSEAAPDERASDIDDQDENSSDIEDKEALQEVRKFLSPLHDTSDHANSTDADAAARGGAGGGGSEGPRGAGSGRGIGGGGGGC